MPDDSTVKHNAKFTRSILDEIQEVINEELDDAEYHAWMLDPFGGVGGVFNINHPALTRIDMVEIQPLWAKHAMSVAMGTDIETKILYGQQEKRMVYCDDFFEWTKKVMRYGQYNIVVTSPTYGNRMADKHHAREDSHRNTYAHTLRRQGEDLHEANSGGLQWGKEYRAFHIKAWKEVWKLLEPGGLFILNIKDHIRKGKLQGVPDWHRDVLTRRGFDHIRTIEVGVRGNRQGENHNVRVEHEEVQVYRKPYLVAKPKAGMGKEVKYTQPAMREES